MIKKQILPLIFQSAMILAILTGSLQAEIFSINFWADSGWTGNGLDVNDMQVNAGESTGYGAFDTDGWENYEVPWGGSGSSVGITGVDGGTATFQLVNARNGGPYNRGNVGNNTVAGQMMDGHANGTEDPFDESAFCKISVTSIPIGTYDVILYLGTQSWPIPDSGGKIILNNGPEQNFILPARGFTSFSQITNATTPGNFVFYKGLSGDLDITIYGNGFNHIGPCGIQIATTGLSALLGLPTQVTNPVPAQGLIGLDTEPTLSWTAGQFATSHDVYFGTDATPDASEFIDNRAGITYTPGTLAPGTYYWRIDERNDDGVTTGIVWQFEVGPPDVAFRPMPYDSIQAASIDANLRWANSPLTTSNDVYFGTDATPDAGEFQGNVTGGTYDPGKLVADTTYYWRVDSINAEGTRTGDVWSFKTAKDSGTTVKVYILAGQSNMEGQGEMSPVGTPGTLEYIVANEPGTYGHYKSGGSWVVRNDVWIWYERGFAPSSTFLSGDLSVGYGERRDNSNMGIELEFGHAMGDFHSEQVLIIKAAWGGQDLMVDFRPPSSGWAISKPLLQGQDGYRYQRMMSQVLDVLANTASYFPSYAGQGIEIAGFGWHQGWNDLISANSSTYYEENMENFINDIRASVGIPGMPFVIASSGMAANGNPEGHIEVEQAQLAMGDSGAYPQFDGNVAAIDTRRFLQSTAKSPTNEGVHWHRNAKTYCLIGDAMAREMQSLLVPPPRPTTRTWIDTQGRVIQARFIRIEGEILFVDFKDKETQIPLSRLSPESKVLALKRQAESNP